MTQNEEVLDRLRIPYEKIKFGKKLEVQGYGTVFEGEGGEVSDVGSRAIGGAQAGTEDVSGVIELDAAGAEDVSVKLEEGMLLNIRKVRELSVKLSQVEGQLSHLNEQQVENEELFELMTKMYLDKKWEASVLYHQLIEAMNDNVEKDQMINRLKRQLRELTMNQGI
ncbi:hypothetical protein L6452_11010 [Arctium lappa]|uniref:Uncharacterized protein n=1 Tax=Arctium lappa TaxID=4217 RepID=A0ACB9DNJ6_ARCLA|nr:hypothetical protein L6452_11010 [Arctium lappa]